MLTKWCNGDQVTVYDYLFTWLDAETKATIMKIFGLKKAREIVMMPMQQQDRSTDCSVFAVATMTSLAHDENNVQASRIEASLAQVHFTRESYLLSKRTFK